MDRLALVTGSTRRLGAHIAARLAESGYTLALHASSDAKAEDWLAQRLDEAGRGWACALPSLKAARTLPIIRWRRNSRGSGRFTNPI